MTTRPAIYIFHGLLPGVLRLHRGATVPSLTTTSCSANIAPAGSYIAYAIEWWGTEPRPTMTSFKAIGRTASFGASAVLRGK